MLCGSKRSCFPGKLPKSLSCPRSQVRVVYEKRLIEQYINEHATEPGTGEALTTDDLLPLQSSRVVRPRPPTLTSIPALLATFQNEWDNLALETYNLKEQLVRTREELATALYQHDAAVRVIARLTKERDEARDSLSKVTVTDGAANGEEMVVDSVETLPEPLAGTNVIFSSLSKGRKRRPVPEGWVTADEVSSFDTTASSALPVSQATSIDLEGGYAALGGLKGEAAVYSIEADKLERQLPVNEAVTNTLWTGEKLFFATSQGNVKVYEAGNEVAAASEHAGPVTGLSIHPGAEILGSVGTDKSIVFYDVATMKRASRAFADRLTTTALTTCAFHPDGHIFAAGTLSGDVKLYMTKNLEQAAVFRLGAPVQAVAFSENGFWLAATAKGQTTVTIFDLRRTEGDAAPAKVLETGGSVQSLAWDYTGQYLATGGASGVTIQQYAKSSKKWSEPFRNSTPVVGLRWGESARKLVAVNGEGVVSVFGVKE
ncbi:cell cycle control protein [Pochonia chlamydosporia 170]|uniref:Pre-mRNA-processing factor 19 n=1 Tax=Pochonia chlamydosporia 170 TaxID=1380566 RepID=A0A179G6V4_METCM|nr:cell cycle control protein [Pochonia chlamydosporia 170]OAQ73522.1 cell cycle control protein [Pochonia chlamydosporia 170]